LSGVQPYHASIVVHNLPAFLFSQDSDLEPLFCPFGDVKEIRKQCAPSTSQSCTNAISIVVTYSSATGAREAKAALHGQIYGDSPLVVESFLPFDNNESSWKLDRHHISRSSLNPCASPFIFESVSAVSAPPTCAVSGDFLDYFSNPISSGLTAPPNLPLSDSATQGHRSLPNSTLPSRTNSAASLSVPLARPRFYA
jgi:hypothetical protein